MLIYLIMVMGIQGMVMTRDLFNLFVFLEIVSVATYGLLGLQDTPAALSATFKYLMATVIASTFFLLGTVLLYAVTGMLNIDDLIGRSNAIAGPIGFAALMFLLASLLIELKPFPANGWGLDVYETAQPDVAALISVGVSAGVFFALLKLLPLFQGQLEVIAVSGAVTFLVSNLIGLRQTKAQRLLGYSSIGQMGLLMMALALLRQLDVEAAIPLVVVGLFVNHLFAKAGLFWLAGIVGQGARPGLVDPGGPSGHDPGICHAAGRDRRLPAFSRLLGEVAFGDESGRRRPLSVDCDRAARHAAGSGLSVPMVWQRHPSVPRPRFPICSVLRIELLPGVRGGLPACRSAGISRRSSPACRRSGCSCRSLRVSLLYLLDGLAGRIKGLLVILLMLTGGIWLIHDLPGINYLFAVLLHAGGLVLAIACLYRSDARRGFYPLLAVMLLSLPALPRATTSLEFLFVWELITLSSYFLIVRRREAAPHALRYLLFSLVSAFFLLAGFAAAYAVNGSFSLMALRAAGPDSSVAFVLLAIGLLIKAGAIGVHVWLPGAYAEADDDVSAMLSALDQQGADVRAAGRHLSRHTFRGELESCAYPGMDRHAHDVGGRHDGGAPGRHQAHAGLFEHEPARLHHNRHRADEPSRLGYRALSRGKSSDGQGNPLPCRRGCHSSHRHPHVRRCGRSRQKYALHASQLRPSPSLPCRACRRSPVSAANGSCSAR